MFFVYLWPDNMCNIHQNNTQNLVRERQETAQNLIGQEKNIYVAILDFTLAEKVDPFHRNVDASWHPQNNLAKKVDPLHRNVHAS